MITQNVPLRRGVGWGAGGRKGFAESSSGIRGRELKSTRSRSRYSIHNLNMVTTTKLHPLQGRGDTGRISVCNIQ